MTLGARLRLAALGEYSAPVLVRCSYRSFRIRGPFERVHRAFNEHECDRPEPKPKLARAETLPTSAFQRP